ncbi:MAG: cation diffusion facilitator family transporter [Pseudoclavibacter sp.]
MSDPSEPPRRISASTIVSLSSSLAEAIAKSIAAGLTGSVALFAEAVHTWADTGDALFLIIAEKESAKPADDAHPYGHGRSIYTWSLLAALGMFSIGGVASIMSGIEGIGSKEAGGDYALGYIVLALSLVLNLVPFAQAALDIIRRGRRERMSMLEYLDQTSTTTLRAVFADGLTGVLGTLLAGAGMLAHQLTGNATWDALASIAIGVVLCLVAIRLASRNGQFLLGRPAPGPQRDDILAQLLGDPDIRRVTFLYTEFVGAGQLAVVAAIEVSGERTQDDLALALQDIADRLTDRPEIIRAVTTLSRPSTPSLAVGM